MTKYAVIIQPSAYNDIDEALEWFISNAPEKLDIWYENLQDDIMSLSSMPKRCKTAPENDAFEEEIRQLLFSRHSSVYRVLFTINDNEVHILHVRHGARNFIEKE